MPTVFHTRELKFEAKKSSLPEFAWQTSPRLAKLAGARQLDFDIRSLDPDRFSFPYHFHRAAEELFLILSGEATLRTPEGFQTVAAEDLVFFEQGDSGAHQLYNHSNAPWSIWTFEPRWASTSEYPTPNLFFFFFCQRCFTPGMLQIRSQEIQFA